MRVSTFMMGLFIVSVGLVTVRFGFKSVAVQVLFMWCFFMWCLF